MPGEYPLDVVAEAIKHDCPKWLAARVLDALYRAGYTVEKGITDETGNLPVFVTDPSRMVANHDINGPALVPARGVKFIPHTRRKSVWHSDECPDCQAEHGVHDRRHAEYQAATRQRDE